MSFRKRNVGISGNQRPSEGPSTTHYTKLHGPGVRPSAVDGRLTTSTGTATLDGLLAGHGGLVLGTSLLIEENGTTDYAGALLRFYAAEGLVQGHHVYVIGLPEQWGRELPGLVGGSDKQESMEKSSEKMKIAWRYERLGQFESGAGARVPMAASGMLPTKVTPESTPQAFCHTFDLTKRLVHSSTSHLDFLTLDRHPSKSPFDTILSRLSSALAVSPADSIHRVVVPSLLSPAIYPSQSSLPQYFLGFQHGLRALLAQYQGRLTLVQSLPLSIYPRSSGLTKWAELLADGVFELAPFPHSADANFQTSRDPSTREEPPQGLLRLHRLPAFHERGVGAPFAETDWSFSLSRRKFTIKPFDLPPIEGDSDAQQLHDSTKHKANPSEMEF